MENVEDSIIVDNIQHNDYYDIVYNTNIDGDINDVIDDYYYDTYSDVVPTAVLDNHSDYNYAVLIDKLENIDEETLQKLLKAIENF
jgi:hypothetical protein